jgi:chemotaxis protein CheD
MTMHTLAPTSEIVLQPGDWHFGDENTRIRTVLGTCVSVVLWHPALRIGGMCHYMLPGRSPHTGGELDGRYADDAFRLMLYETRLRGTRIS